MNRDERKEFLKELDRRVADPIFKQAADEIRYLQERLDNANEASTREYHWYNPRYR